MMKTPLLIVTALLCNVAVSAQVKVSPEVAPYVKVNAQRVVLTHVRIIDGTGAPAVDDQTILIEDGKIIRISKNAPVDSTAQVLDLHGDTVLPGLVGMHEHLFYIERPDSEADGSSKAPLIAGEMAFSSPRMYLAAGVTTMRTAGSVEPYTDLNLKREIDAGNLPGPHIDVTAPYLEGPGSPLIQLHPLNSPDEAREAVSFWASQGATSFKAYMFLHRAELKAAIDAAHARGFKVTGHLCAVTYPEAVEAGIDNLEHGFFVNTQSDPGKKADVCPMPTVGTATLAGMEPNGPAAVALINLLVSHHVAITSTLPVFESFVPSHLKLQDRVLDAMAPHAREAYLYSRNLELTRTAAENTQRALMYQHGVQLEKEFYEAGGLLMAGVDPTGDGGALAGYGDQREIELLVDGGFSPLVAIKIATLNGATFLGRDHQIGSIAVGKNADLVVVKGNPIQNIGDIENVELVFKDGVGYDSPKLFESVKGRYGEY
jgi:imidazolonepropionase-like amidohydrolase